MTNIPILPPPRPAPNLPDFVRSDARLSEAAVQLEATFLAEMLKNAGLGRTQSEFDGGIGEDQFSGFLVAEQARALAAKGGIGLAETIYAALLDQAEARR